MHTHRFLPSVAQTLVGPLLTYVQPSTNPTGRFQLRLDERLLETGKSNLSTARRAELEYRRTLLVDSTPFVSCAPDFTLPLRFQGLRFEPHRRSFFFCTRANQRFWRIVRTNHENRRSRQIVRMNRENRRSSTDSYDLVQIGSSRVLIFWKIASRAATFLIRTMTWPFYIIKSLCCGKPCLA